MGKGPDIKETREFMAQKLLADTIHKAIEKAKIDKPNLKKYYIFITSKLDAFNKGVIRQALKISNVKPPKLINSMCFYVDIEQGKLDCEWVLPIDTDTNDALIGPEEAKLVYNSIAN